MKYLVCRQCGAVWIYANEKVNCCPECLCDSFGGMNPLVVCDNEHDAITWLQCVIQQEKIRCERYKKLYEERRERCDRLKGRIDAMNDHWEGSNWLAT